MSRYYTHDPVDRHGNLLCAEGECIIRIGTGPCDVAESLLEGLPEYILGDVGSGRTVTIKIIPVQWGDCWIKSTERIDFYDHVGLFSRPPGEHPGGNVYWHVPDDDVYALCIEVEDDD